MKRIIIAVISWLILCFPVWGDSSIWKVSKKGAELYLGGTCHMLRSSDYPLPAEFDRAYAQSEIIVFETDIGKLNTPEVQQTLLGKMSYSDGTSLKDHLSPQTYEVLDRFCENIGLPLDSLNSFKPAMVMLILTVLELQKQGMSDKGVDMYYYQQSLQDKKQVTMLETVDEQINIIASMGVGYEDAYVRHSLEDLNRIKEIMELLINHWRQGNREDLARLFIEPIKRDFPEIYRTILVARNESWLPKIEEFMSTSEKEFVLVGFAHLVGEDGIIEQLRKRGYKVEKL